MTTIPQETSAVDAKVAKRPAFDACGRRIGIFVIAYNAEAHIQNVFERISDDIWNAIEVAFVIDDCSTDNTVSAALELRNRYSKMEIIRNRINQRYGGNQKVGYQYAIDRGLDVVVMLHADGQYAPECLPDLLEPLISNQASVVFGSRMLQSGRALQGNMPKYKYFGNIVLTRIQNTLCGTDFSEFHSGYRAYAVDFLKEIPFWENTDEWHFDTEILLQALISGVWIKEVPIPTYYGNEICYVNGMAYAANCVLLSLRFALYRYGLFYCRAFDVTLDGRKYFEKFDDPYSSHSLILKEITRIGLEGKKVLELGVGDASMTKIMSERAAVLDCVEYDPALAHLATPYARHVVQGNVENIEAFKELDRDYDIILAADILEHLVHPDVLLSKLKTHTKRGGYVIVSLPNIANLYVRLNLLLGRFPVHRKGILDATHLHHYTLSTAEKLVKKSGWVVLDQWVTAIPLAIVFPFLRRGPCRWIHAAYFQLTRLFKGLLAYQVILSCQNTNSGDLL